jgi:hypothetical protein
MSKMSQAHDHPAVLVGECLVNVRILNGQSFILPSIAGVTLIGRWGLNDADHVVRTAAPYGSSIVEVREIVHAMYAACRSSFLNVQYHRSIA